MPGKPEPPTAIVALVASAGGIRALGNVLARLPATLDAAVIVVLHLMGDRRSHLAEVLARSTTLPVQEARDGTHVLAGHVYVAPPDAHLLVRNGGIVLDPSPPVRFLRPNADMLLASLAEAYGDRCVAAVLSGTGTDGAEGAAAVHAAGGFVIAQDEATSEYFGMPGAAIARGAVDRVLPLDEIGDEVAASFAGTAT